MAGSFASSQALAANFSAELSTATSQLTASDDVVVTLTVTNNESTPQRLLKWYTAEEGVKEALFTVTRDGKELQYLGAHYKRPAPTAKDYLTLESGESLTWQVDLSHQYDMTQTGDYRITFDVQSFSLYQEQIATARGGLIGHDVADAGIGKLSSNTLDLWIEGNFDRQTNLPPATDFVTSTSFSNCSNSEKTSINSAVTAAKSMATKSMNSLNGGYSSLYNTFFGSNNSSRFSTVKSHFTKIKDAVYNKNMVFDCSCNEGYFAYVYPSQPYKIYLCNAFWSASTYGRDSKGGTIIHELSHFTILGGTDDHVYGESDAKYIATYYPSYAIDNADNHEYFAEDAK
jgi:peptidyl-Lys metalloendopeptidase